MPTSAWRPVFRPLNASTFPIPRVFQALAKPTTTTPTHTSAAQAARFSTTPRLEKRKGKGGKSVTDPRVTNIRYHLSHPLTPRPLHFSRTRYLRHWTIHRAWQLFQRQRRNAEERELERMYESMRAACEHLRLLDNNGIRVSEAEAGGQGADPGRLGPKGKEVGRLYRGAMNKRGLRGCVPVEYARVQVDYPGREGWNHGWER